MKRLKYVFHIQKDIAGEEGHTVLSITQRGIIPKDFSNNEGQFANSYANYQLVHKGDFAMNHMDLLTGWVDISKYEGVTSPDYRVFVLNDKNGMCPKYYLYMMQMCYSARIFYGLGQGVSGMGRWRLQADKFLNFYIPIPPYDEQKKIADYITDIVLFANGIPVVSMELKCQFTGQDTTNAINQYKFDRAGKDAIFAFKERVLVHFAVDLTNVYMTTRLEGAHTYFLPFNQGSNGAGKVGGKGNPVNPNGYDTAYLWERVLCKDSLMEILQKYMHLQQEYDKNGNLVKETMIFPRYHQLDVVTKLLEDVKKNGSGKSYLIQHSAGSGKSNSIAWLAHRLTGLHDYEDNKIFQSVIIVTDRRVLDSQLQSTVYQFDHVEGVVKKVDKNSGQLRDAINDGVGIIITTLQKFPVIYKEVDSAKKRFAIIIDEAHSSQTGDAAKKLKRALADTEVILKEYAEPANKKSIAN